MTLSDIQQLVSLKLGEQSLFYPSDEVTRSGINPVQRLFALVYPLLLRQRVAVTVDVDLPIIDLRTLVDSDGVILGNRIRRVVRVSLGNVSGDLPTHNPVTDELHELRQITVGALSKRSNDWMSQRGIVLHYWLWGYWLGVYKRPVVSTTITVVYSATPKQLTFDADIPQVQDVYHAAIAEAAAGLLAIKEGAPIGERALAKISQALQLKQQGQAA